MLPNDVPSSLANVECPDLGAPIAIPGPIVSKRRVTLISTAGLSHAGDRPFSLGSAGYRIIDAYDSRPLVMTHISTNFDRSAFASDVDVVFPLRRMHEKQQRGEIGSVARFHYSFMGATTPSSMQPAAEQLATLLQNDSVDLALLIPV